MSDINKMAGAFETVVAGEATATTVALSVTAASQAVALLGNLVPATNPPNQCSVVNTGTVAVFVVFGPSTTGLTATIPASGGANGGFCVLPGQERVLSVPQGTRAVSCIGAAAGPSLVYFTLGKGR